MNGFLHGAAPFLCGRTVIMCYVLGLLTVLCGKRLSFGTWNKNDFDVSFGRFCAKHPGGYSGDLRQIGLRGGAAGKLRGVPALGTGTRVRRRISATGCSGSPSPGVFGNTAHADK